MKLLKATPKEAASRRKSLKLAYETKIFEAIRRGMRPVPLAGPLSDRSEILLGLKKAGESNDDARYRIAQDFIDKHPDLYEAGIVDD